MLDNGHEFVINGISMLEKEINPSSPFFKSCQKIKACFYFNKLVNSIYKCI